MLDLMIAMSLMKVVTPEELARIKLILAEGQSFMPESMKSVKQGLYQLTLIKFT